MSENSNIVSYLYKDRIVKEIENKISLNVNFNDFRVKWEGLNPQLIFNDLSLYSKKDNNIIPLTLSLIATANTDPKIGPMHGLQPNAKATPIINGKK